MSLGYLTLTLIVYALAVARLTRLVNADTIFDPLRIRIAHRRIAAQQEAAEADTAGQPARMSAAEKRQARWATVEYFVGCPWCVSMWLAFGTVWVPIWHAHNVVAVYVGVALAVSHLVGVFARFGADEDIAIETS